LIEAVVAFRLLREDFRFKVQNQTEYTLSYRKRQVGERSITYLTLLLLNHLECGTCLLVVLFANDVTVRGGDLCDALWRRGMGSNELVTIQIFVSG